eukprot:1188825-Prorocentrum_minimum.AAC.1
MTSRQIRIMPLDWLGTAPPPRGVGQALVPLALLPPPPPPPPPCRRGGSRRIASPSGPHECTAG